MFRIPNNEELPPCFTKTPVACCCFRHPASTVWINPRQLLYLGFGAKQLLCRVHKAVGYESWHSKNKLQLAWVHVTGFPEGQLQKLKTIQITYDQALAGAASTSYSLWRGLNLGCQACHCSGFCCTTFPNADGNYLQIELAWHMWMQSAPEQQGAQKSEHTCCCAALHSMMILQSTAIQGAPGCSAPTAMKVNGCF